MPTRTALNRLAFLVSVAIALWIATSALAHYALDQFPNFGEATWSGLRHLFDPGALADDNTAGERITGVVQLLIGLVFIVGLLVAVVQDALAGSLRRLAEGDPHVRASRHVAIVGWNELVPEITSELSNAATGGTVAVLVPASMRGRRPEIEQELNPRGAAIRTRVIAGDPGPAGFERAGVRRARAVVVASGAEAGTGDPEASDLGTISACLAVREHLGSAAEPSVFPLLRRGRNVDAISDRLPASWEYVVADRAATGIAGAAAAHPELTAVLAAGFSGEAGPALVRALALPDDRAGQPFSALVDALPEALPVGLMGATGELELVPSPDRVVNAGDRLLAAPRAGPAGVRPAPAAPAGSSAVGLAAPAGGPRRLLCMAPRDTVEALIEDLGERAPGRFELTVLTQSVGSGPGGVAPENVDVRPQPLDPEEPAEIARLVGAAAPDTILIGSDPGAQGDSADARALLTAFQLASRRQSGSAPILVDVLARHAPSVAADDRRMHLISRGAMVAQWVGLLLTDRASAAATAALVEGRAARLEVASVQTGDGPISFAAVYRGLAGQGLLPIGTVAADGSPRLRPTLEDTVDPGQRLILIRRCG